MSPILFSVIIPTRQRHDTLKSAIQSVLNQTYPHFELIIMDNFSTSETAEVVNSFPDLRIKYYRAPERLSMTDNWELGLAHATGDYVFILGDDDALMPDGLEIGAQLIQEHQLSIISWNRFFYWWPNAIIPWRRNRLRMGLSQDLYYLKSSEILSKYSRYQVTYEYLPMVYNSLIHQDLINQIKSVYGKYFMSYSPDVYSGLVNAYFSLGYLYSFRPLSIVGISEHSIGASASYPSLDSQPLHDFVSEHKNNLVANIHPRLIPSLNPYITLADVFLRTQERFFPDHREFDLSIKDLLDKMAARINVDPGSYETTLENIQALAEKHNIPISNLTIPSRTLAEQEPPQGVFFDQDSSLNTLIINCEQADISNVYQAAKLAQGILPPKTAIRLKNQVDIKAKRAVISASPHEPQPQQQMSNLQEVVNDQKFLNRLVGCLNLHYIDPEDQAIISELRTLRRQLAEFWLTLETNLLQSSYLGEAGKRHQMLLNSTLKNQPLTSDEQAFLEQVNSQIASPNHPPNFNAILAASLYVHIEQLPKLNKSTDLPPWLVKDYQILVF
jgi:glycosyltransferase involved in cell wall biosynthesis